MVTGPGAQGPSEPDDQGPSEPGAQGPIPPGGRALGLLATAVLVAGAVAVAAYATWEEDPPPPLPNEPPPAAVGVWSTATARSPEQALDAVEAKLKADGRQKVFARVDHPDDPSGANVRLVSVETLVFSDPRSWRRSSRATSWPRSTSRSA